MTEQQVLEPLAKFHARVDVNGRILIPKYIRDTYGINPGDFVFLLVRIIQIDKESRKVYVLNQFKFSAKINARGLVVIPKHFRDQYDLKPETLVEVLLLDHHKPNEPNIYTTYTYVFKLFSNKYQETRNKLNENLSQEFHELLV